MYYLLYIDGYGRQTWETVAGEDAMQIRVSELMDTLGLEAEDIIVFDECDQL